MNDIPISIHTYGPVVYVERDKLNYHAARIAPKIVDILTWELVLKALAAGVISWVASKVMDAVFGSRGGIGDVPVSVELEN